MYEVKDLILLFIVLAAYYFHTLYPHPTKWWIMLK